MDKKILLTLSLALIAIVMASAVSADENVTIDGIDFNIPDGYVEDVTEEIVNETETDEDGTYVTNGKFYDEPYVAGLDAEFIQGFSHAFYIASKITPKQCELIGSNGNNSCIWLNGAEGEVCCFRTALAEGVEKC